MYSALMMLFGIFAKSGELARKRIYTLSFSSSFSFKARLNIFLSITPKWQSSRHTIVARRFWPFSNASSPKESPVRSSFTSVSFSSSGWLSVPLVSTINSARRCFGMRINTPTLPEIIMKNFVPMSSRKEKLRKRFKIPRNIFVWCEVISTYQCWRRFSLFCKIHASCIYNRVYAARYHRPHLCIPWKGRFN